MTSQNSSDFSMGDNKNIGNVNNIQGYDIRAVQGDNNHVVIGDGNIVSQNIEGVDSLIQSDIFQLLTKLESLVNKTEIPTETKAEVIEDLNAAKIATNREKPNKKRALDRLTTVAETLEKTSKSLDAGQKIWQVAKPILVKAATLLGAAVGSHLLNL